ncbi:MAG: cysteine desulfurase [Oscillospiraceae bacterium]|nr:cysteine desulfurase [Oscillospiraceae bacterium]
MEHYLDNAATTRVSDAAAQAALAAMTGGFGNPSSRHQAGARAAQALKEHRAVIAGALGAKPEEVVFTSCGTESDNWAIRGAVRLNRRVGKHIITTAIEHDAVLQPCRALEREGYEVTCLKPDRMGNITVQQVADALREDTALVSMMLVNNELGTLLPVAEVAKLLKQRKSAALLHCDAVQGFLHVPFTVGELGVDLLSISGHKVHAPKGVGALYIKSGVKLPGMIVGGHQENDLRSGTEATAQIAAFAAAVSEGVARFDRDQAYLKELKAYAVEKLTGEVAGLECIGNGEAPHILPVTLVGYKSEVVVRFLSDRGIFISSGSACHKGKPSHVFAALNLPKKQMDGVLRVSFSGENTREDVDALVDGLKQAKEQLFTSLS